MHYGPQWIWLLIPSFREQGAAPNRWSRSQKNSRQVCTDGRIKSFHFTPSITTFSADMVEETRDWWCINSTLFGSFFSSIVRGLFSFEFKWSTILFLYSFIFSIPPLRLIGLGIYWFSGLFLPLNWLDYELSRRLWNSRIYPSEILPPLDKNYGRWRLKPILLEISNFSSLVSNIRYLTLLSVY